VVQILSGRLPCSSHSADQKFDHHVLHFALVRGKVKPRRETSKGRVGFCL